MHECPIKEVGCDRCYSSRLNPTRRWLSRVGVLESSTSPMPHSPLTRQPQAQAITQCTSWRSDGSPSCLGGSPHGWVTVNTHSTPVPGTPGRLWVAHSPEALHNQAMSPRPIFFQHGSGATVGPGRECSAGVLLVVQVMRRTETRPRLKHTAKPKKVSSVHHCRHVDDCRMHTCGPRGTWVGGVNSYSCDCDPGFQETDIDGDK